MCSINTAQHHTTLEFQGLIVLVAMWKTVLYVGIELGMAQRLVLLALVVVVVVFTFWLEYQKFSPGDTLKTDLNYWVFVVSNWNLTRLWHCNGGRPRCCLWTKVSSLEIIFKRSGVPMCAHFVSHKFPQRCLRTPQWYKPRTARKSSLCWAWNRLGCWHASPTARK